MKHIQTRSAGCRAERVKEANARNERWAKLAAKVQITDLDRRLGVGQGAKRQRAKLAGKK